MFADDYMVEKTNDTSEFLNNLKGDKHPANSNKGNTADTYKNSTQAKV